MGSGGDGSGMEWMLSMGGIGVDASETSGGGMGVSSAIVLVAIGMISGSIEKGPSFQFGDISWRVREESSSLTRRACRSFNMHLQ